MNFSDQDLKNYLDGIADEQSHRGIETALETDDHLAERLMALDSVSATVASAFEHLPEPSRVDALESDIGFQNAHNGRSGARWMSLAAALVAGVGLGWAIFANTGQPHADWRQHVANYQVLYGVETVDHLKPTPAKLMEQFARAENAIGRTFDVEQLDQVAGLTLKRAQVLELDGKALIQIVYQSDAGLPIALCIFKEKTDATNKYMADLAANSWQSEGYGFLLIGGRDLDQTEAWSTQFRSVL